MSSLGAGLKLLGTVMHQSRSSWSAI